MYKLKVASEIPADEASAEPRPVGDGEADMQDEATAVAHIADVYALITGKRGKAASLDDGWHHMEWLGRDL